MSNSRLEKFIYAICSMEVSDLPAPLSRIEILWNCLITGETPDFEPQSRNEQYLMAMLGLYELENLPTPMSRGEKLLYKIAMGETDLSDIPAYLSRYEELLGYLAENGGVGDFEYILQTLNQRLSTLYSTKERPMKQSVIKGDTLVNELPRPSLKNTMMNVESQKLNQGYDNGKTLVNLITKKNHNKPYTIADRNIAINPNTKYIAFFDLLNVNVTTSIDIGAFIITSSTETTYNIGDNADVLYTFNVKDGLGSEHRISRDAKSLIFTSGANEKWLHIRTGGSVFNFAYDNLMIIKYQDGMENWDIPYFEGTKTFSATPNVVDGEFKQAVVKGQTLVNVYDYTSSTFIGEATIENGVITLKANGGWVVINNNKLPMLKPNTNYTIFVNILSNTLNYSSTELDYALRVEGDTGNSGFITGFDIPKGSVGIFKKLLTTKESFSTTNLSDVRVHANANGGEIKFTYMIIEGDHTQEDIPYFEGMQSVQLSEVTTTGNNLYKSAVSIWNNNQYIISGTSKDVPCDTVIDPSTEYVLSWNGNNRNGKVIFFNNGAQTRSIDINWWASSIVFTTNKDENGFSYYIRLEADQDEITYTNFNVQLEKGSVATTYEPYQSNTLTLSEPVTLRKVGEIQDEFDALTGQVTERVGEVVLDGSDDELWSVDTSLSNHYKFLTPLANDYYKGQDIIASSVISDKYPSINNGEDSGGMDVESICINGWAPESRGRLNLSISKTKLSDGSVEALKTYLQQNPFTVQYRLATPTTKQVNTTITDQDGAMQTKLHSFNDGYLSVSSQGLLPSAVNYEVPTNNSYYLPDMLTLGAKYTSRGSVDCNATIDGKLLALGKNRTFTTPSSVTDKLMVLDAPVDDLMFIKGDQTAKDFGYFEGMKSVGLSNKMPVLTTTGKNLFDKDKEILKYYYFDNLGNYMTSPSSDNFIDETYYHVNNSNKITLSNRAANGSAPLKICTYDINKNFIRREQGSVNYVQVILTNDEKYIRIGGGISNIESLQLEFGDETSYEPYKSNILTVNEDVELRGIGDVQDTLDCLTGEVVERIGEIVLDGSEDWNDSTVSNNLGYKRYCALISHENNPSYLSVLAMNDRLFQRFDKPHDNYEYLYIQREPSGTRVFIQSTMWKSSSELKSYLQSNPITVQYQLETESIKTVDLTTVDQDGQPTKLKTFDDITHVEMNADNIIPSVDVEVATKISETLATLDPQQNDISNTQNKLSQTIDEQTENTDATMMATTEIYEQTL